ncbi:hypothetical protein YC2023_043096 [Brassica napus]
MDTGEDRKARAREDISSLDHRTLTSSPTFLTERRRLRNVLKLQTKLRQGLEVRYTYELDNFVFVTTFGENKHFRYHIPSLTYTCDNSILSDSPEQLFTLRDKQNKRDMDCLNLGLNTEAYISDKTFTYSTRTYVVVTVLRLWRIEWEEACNPRTRSHNEFANELKARTYICVGYSDNREIVSSGKLNSIAKSANTTT